MQCNRMGQVTQDQGTAIWSIPFDLASAKVAANWVHALTAEWVDSKRRLAPMSRLAALGHALCDLAGSWAVDLCRSRRYALKTNIEYASRLRDPPGLRAIAVSPHESPYDSVSTALPVSRRRRKSDVVCLQARTPTTSQRSVARHNPAKKRQSVRSKPPDYDIDGDIRESRPLEHAVMRIAHTLAADPALVLLAPHVVRNSRWKVP